MISDLLKLFHIHWFRQSWASYTHAYEACRCSKRRARQLHLGGYAPVALWWLEGLDAPRAPAGMIAPPSTRPRPLSVGVPGPGVRCAR